MDPALTQAIAYVSMVAQVTLGLVFATSAIGKVLNMAEFARTIVQFKLLPPRITRVAATLVVVGESSIVVLLMAGGIMTCLAAIMALMLLLIFSGAISSALARNLDTACSCFGSNRERISPYELWRNGVLILCCLLVLAPLVIGTSIPRENELATWLLIGTTAGILTIVLTNLHRIGRLVRMS